MWFSPLKGAHLTLGQLDKTLPVDGAGANGKNKTIQRGMFMFITTGGVKGEAGKPSFQLYTSAEAKKPNAVPYIALMGYDDYQAGMAGNIGQAVQKVDGADEFGVAPDTDQAAFLNKTYTKDSQHCIGPRITGISVLQPAEYQTTAFDKDAETWYVGQPLTINDDGVLTPFDADDASNIVGYVTEIPTRRWVNNLGVEAPNARISGGYVKAISFSTAWIPVAVSAGTPAVPGEGGAEPTPAVPGNVDALKVGAPKVVPAAGAKAPEAPAAPAGAKAPAAPAAPAAQAK